MGYFWGQGRVLELCLGSSHIVDQLLFSKVSSILTFDFDFWGRGRAQKLFLGLLI